MTNLLLLNIVIKIESYLCRLFIHMYTSGSLLAIKYIRVTDFQNKRRISNFVPLLFWSLMIKLK